VLIDISKTQDEEVGDGTTSVCVLAGELLRQAEKLMEQQLHPQLIVAGFRRAADIARAKLEEMAVDHSDDKAKFRDDLLKIAQTTLSSKVLSQDKKHFAEMAVSAASAKDCAPLGTAPGAPRPCAMLHTRDAHRRFLPRVSPPLGALPRRWTR
jgi:T-complex protein 1 subunit beta